jgi:hypothetical protein
VSAIGVALGFAAQAGGGIGGTFTVVALVGLPLALLLGLALSFGRSSSSARRTLHRRHEPDQARHGGRGPRQPALPRVVDLRRSGRRLPSLGTGIRLHPPRYRLAFALVQTQGIVAVICGAIAAVTGGLATLWLSQSLAWAVGAVVFLAVVVGMLRYWTRAFAQIEAALRPMFPTPPEAVDAPL